MAAKETHSMSRREFLKGAAKAGLVAGVAAAGLGRLGGIAFAQQGGKSRVVQVISKGVMKDNIPDAAMVEKMLDKAMCELGGKKTADEVWKGIFTKDDVVCLKINCIATNRASTKPQLVAAIVKGLVSAGVKENNVIVWERNANEMKGAGYTINAGASGVRYVGTDMPGFGYSDQMTAGCVTSRISKILTEKATAMINVPILKNHGGPGITLALKNHFGTIDNPNTAHGKKTDIQKFIADLNTIDPIKKKTRLVVADCLRCVFEGGPAAKNPDMELRRVARRHGPGGGGLHGLADNRGKAQGHGHEIARRNAPQTDAHRTRRQAGARQLRPCEDRPR
jgi:uncharacterized protein (DUF362 family)